MFFLNILITSLLCIKLSMTENDFYKTKGPYFVSKEAVNWTDARILCKNAELELASIISEGEQAALKTFLTENNLVPEDKWSGYWLSGVRHSDGKYYWDSTGIEIDSSFRGWLWGEPSHAYQREDCVELKWDNVDLGWNDYFCDETRKYICEIPRKYKTKTAKKKTLQKWMIKKGDDYNVHRNLAAKESEVDGKAEDLFDNYWTTLGEDYDYTTQGRADEAIYEIKEADHR